MEYFFDLLLFAAVGWSRSLVLGGKSLQEFRESSPLEPSRYTAEQSLQTMLALGFLKITQVRPLP